MVDMKRCPKCGLPERETAIREIVSDASKRHRDMMVEVAVRGLTRGYSLGRDHQKSYLGGLIKIWGENPDANEEAERVVTEYLAETVKG